jgi:hypothetical protein
MSGRKKGGHVFGGVVGVGEDEGLGGAGVGVGAGEGEGPAGGKPGIMNTLITIVATMTSAAITTA